ncbi:MAG: SDR family NAD(P)-dependent oxidoreductase [Patescibacteria group bacterium]
MRLSNKTAIVTGASSGIGNAIAVAFSKEGANVIYSDINEIEGFVPTEKSDFIKCDVSDRVQVDGLVEETVSRFGGLDIMVNNAGIGSLGGVLETDDENWQKVLGINLSGAFFGLRAASKYMTESGVAGSVINMSSILGKVGLKGAFPYCVSKGGVVQMTHAAALDLVDSNVRVNAIAPGFIETKMTEFAKENEDFHNMIVSSTPMGHMGQPEDIASAAVYLASDESKYVTGEVLYVDGGWTAR